MAPVCLKLQKEGQLQAFSGEWAKIESSTRNEKTTHKIVAKHPQGEGSKVSLWTLEMDNNVCMAFCFKQKKQDYFAAVNKETSEIQVETLSDMREVDNKFLFRWVNPHREWKHLRSLAEPSKYLSISDSVFTLSTSKETLFQFRCKTTRGNIKARRKISRVSLL